MGEGLKKTGKIALYIITHTVILLLVLVFIWAYKKYKKKAADKITGKERGLLSKTASENVSEKEEAIIKLELIERKPEESVIKAENDTENDIENDDSKAKKN